MIKEDGLVMTFDPNTIEHFGIKMYSNLPAQHTTTDRKALAITAPLRYGGGSANINSCAFNKYCASRQFSASNPPQLKAAKRF